MNIKLIVEGIEASHIVFGILAIGIVIWLFTKRSFKYRSKDSSSKEIEVE